MATWEEPEGTDEVDLGESFLTEQSARKDLTNKSKDKQKGDLYLWALFCCLLAEKRRKQLLSGLKDSAHFLHYKPIDHHSELGLSLGGSSFDAQANSAMLDMEGDDQQLHGKPKLSSKRW